MDDPLDQECHHLGGFINCPNIAIFDALLTPLRHVSFRYHQTEIEKMDRYDIFRRDVPARYLGDCLLGLFEDYLSSAEFCSDRFEKTEAINILPFYRRGMIESRLRECITKHKGMKACVERDDSGFWNHTVITAGDCMITQSTVRNPSENVRSSYARLTYAEPDNQRYLDESFKPVTPSRQGFVYGILVHGREKSEKFFPAFAQIVFPRRNLDGYYSRRIDLFAEFPEIVRRCTSGIFEERRDTLERQYEEIDLPDPELRDDLGDVL